MAISRQAIVQPSDTALIEEKKLKNETLARLRKLRGRTSLTSTTNTYMVSKDAILHCYIPVCIGYGNGSMGAEELAALVTGIRESGYDFTIIAAPRVRFDKENEDPYVVWQRENVELLREIQDKVVLERDWRKSDRWKDAYLRYEKFKLANTDVIQKILLDDMEKYINRKKGSIIECANSIGESEIRQHMIDCVVDCISLMLPLPNDPNEEIKRINVLVYTHKLTQLMHQAFMSAEKIGCLPRSLEHVEPKFERCYEQRCMHGVSEQKISPVQYAQSLTQSQDDDVGLTIGERQAIQLIGQMAIDPKADPLHLGKVIATMVTAFEAERRLHQAPAISASSALSTTSSSSGGGSSSRHASPFGRASGMGMFGPVTRTQRPGTAAALASSQASTSTHEAVMADQQGRENDRSPRRFGNSRH